MYIKKTIESYDVVDGDEFERFFQSCIRVNNTESVHPLHLPPTPRFNLLNPMPFMGHQIRYRRMYTRGELKMRESRQSPKVSISIIIIYFY